MGHDVGKTFSESWHRVADLRVTLRSTVTVRKQLFRGKHWYVLQDPFNNHFFRLEKSAYAFVAHLNSAQSIAEIWQKNLQQNPETAPGQDEVIRLLAQLYHANLLFCELPIDSQKLFERYRKRQQKEQRGKLSSLMFFRIPLFDPDAWLNRHPALVQLLTSRAAFGAWLIVLLLAGKTVIEQLPQLLSETESLLSINNLLLLYCGLALVKILHEIGHTLVCKRFGGEVHTIGIMLIVFAPLPYMDATSSWSLRKRRERILVASAGMIFEFFAAACAALVWASTGPGVIHSLALNMLIVASVSTLVFNANPLLRYDGYYILSDLLDIPNLQPRSLEQLKYLARRYLFGLRQASSPTDNRKEFWWLSIYGIFSGAYRLIVYTGIILLVADRFLLLGLLMAVFCLLIWGIMPLGRFIGYLISSPELARVRSRAVFGSLILSLIVVFLLGIIPVPNRFRAPGIIEAQNHLLVTSQTAGQLSQILQPNGSQVVSGQPLLQLVNPELDIEIKLTHAQRDEILYLQQQSAAFQADATRITLKRRLHALDSRLAELQRRHQALLVTAEAAGTWFAPNLEQHIDSWLERGKKLGDIVSTDGFKFVAVVGQEDAASLFSDQTSEQVTVRLSGLENSELQIVDYQVIPFEQVKLPSATLGWKGGGTIPVKGQDDQGLETIEPFFRISADLKQLENHTLRHGHSGQIRFSLAAQPLFTQAYRKLRQFIQKRYQT
ncbi:MAG: hypothetical protein QNK27_12215 [Desulfuromusa sp.]|nr:hypothetical protein [Desulfuromusa sp.]